MTLKTLALTALASLALSSAVTLPAKAQDFVLKVSAANAPNEQDSVYAWMLAFEKGVEARSEGRIDVQLFPSNQLGQQPAAVQGAAMGTIEVTVAIVGLIASIEPRFQVLDAPGIAETPEGMMRAMQTPEVRKMLSEFGAGAGVQPLAIIVDGQGVVVSRNPIETTDDFKGIKIRTGGATPLLNDPLVALGAAPVSLPLGEVVPALQTGTIDAATSSVAIANIFHMADVAKNLTYLPGNFVTVGIIINRAFLDTVGPDLAAIILDEGHKAESVAFPHLEHAPDQEAAFTAQGGRIIRMDDAQREAYLAKVTPIVAGIVAKDAQMQADFDVLKAAAEATR